MEYMKNEDLIQSTDFEDIKKYLELISYKEDE